MNKYNELINKFNMLPHPEGGYFVETYKDSNGHMSHIYYLLKKGEISHWHKLSKNENLHFYDGDPIKIFLSDNKINLSKIILGKNFSKNQQYNFTVKAETWFSMESLGDWSLIGCIVAPAFEYKDLELAPPNWNPEKK